MRNKNELKRMKGHKMDLKTAKRLLANQSKEGLLRVIVSLSGEPWEENFCRNGSR